jgi:hypothetical protein
MLTHSSTFTSFISKEKLNLQYLIVAIIAVILQIIIFKQLYPFADFFSDSYSYIYAAATHMDANIWPIGYSKFIAMFHKITYSDTALVTCQYLFVEVTALYFFFTIRYFYQPVSPISTIIFIFLFFNPLYLYLSNYISSDAIFLALSILWITELIWLIHRSKPYHIYTLTAIVTIAFTLRYNAIYYPVITAIAFILLKQPIKFKAIGIVLPCLLIGIFIVFTSNKTKELTGTKQFSVFSGWQLANNALYMYPHLTLDQYSPPTECLAFDETVKHYFKIVPEELKYPSPRNGAFYIKFLKAPLKDYLLTHYDIDKDTTGGIGAWGAVSPIYAAYGKFLIIHYPIAFIQYFLLPNTLNYGLPPLEKLEIYNVGDDQVQEIALLWFHYPTTYLKVISKTAQGRVLFLFPAFFLAVNVFFVVCFFGILQRGRKNIPKGVRYDLIMVSSLFIINAAFSILASPIVFRYQIFPMIVYFVFSMLVTGKADSFEKKTI